MRVVDPSLNYAYNLNTYLSFVCSRPCHKQRLWKKPVKALGMEIV